MAVAQQISPHRISISVDVRMHGAVKSISSPTHPTLVDDGKRTVASSSPLKSARYSSKDYLSQDFVLVITAEGLDAPRCFAQRAANGSTAMQLNIVPNFRLPPISTQEYIFLVDRSGSMKGSRIETAKKALVMLLRALPSQGTHFNIFSFGNACDCLWERSVLYDGDTLEAAVSFGVFSMVLVIYSVFEDNARRHDVGQLWRNKNTRRIGDGIQHTP